ncbi:MAG: prepilin-type N-terminal cleavage/methylation domain-containing protein [Crocinitomicaceae bacterium]|jgi:prepilin-type N-terminal cleavage/methylation domain-containing protein
MKNKKGFTLIELLVVVAIIGILATVVLASLGQARTKAKDAAAKSALTNARAEMELHYLDNDGYEDVTDSTECTDVVTDFNTSFLAQTGNSPTCNATAIDYAYFGLLSDDTEGFCVDSTGFAGEATPANTAIVCNA